MNDIEEIKNQFTSIKNQLIEITVDKEVIDSCNSILDVDTWNDLMTFMPFLEVYIDDFLETSTDDHIDCIHVSFNEKDYYVDIHFYYLSPQNRYFIYIEDNSLKYNAKRIIQQQRNEYFIYSEHLSTIQKEKDLFFQKINHEIRNPLQNAMVIVDDVMAKHTEEASSLKHVQRNLGNVVKITKDILDLGKLNQATLSLLPSSNSLSALFQILKEKNQFNLNLNDNTLHVSLPEKMEDKKWEIDDVRFQQIFDNLIGNANKFTECGEIEIGVSDWEVVNDTQDRIHFYIQDNGVGMTQEQANIIFDDFVQIHNTKKRSGAGLGLSIVKQLVKMHQGKIHAKSQKGNGTRIVFDLTLKKAEPLEEIIYDSQPAKLSDLNILIVDDDDLTLLVTKNALKRVLNNCFTAKSIDQTFKILKEHKVDIILSDFNIAEDYNAYQLKNDIESTIGENSIKWFILSGDILEEKEVKANGFLAALIKPQPIQGIKQILERHI
jgi:signal transduction histidine kinase